ncbi:MAG: cupin domain-containing protein [Bacteroidota bacterium]|nr:cupin domain-containing protein [Bacteroidota bacterium]
MAIYPLHIHPDKTEFAYVIDGNPEFFIDSQYFIGKSGDFFYFS